MYIHIWVLLKVITIPYMHAYRNEVLPSWEGNLGLPAFYRTQNNETLTPKVQTD